MNFVAGAAITHNWEMTVDDVIKHNLNNTMTILLLSQQAAEEALSAGATICAMKTIKKMNKFLDRLCKQIQSIDNPQMTSDVTEVTIDFLKLLQSGRSLEITINHAGFIKDIVNQNTWEETIDNIVKNAVEAGATAMDAVITSKKIIFADNGHGFSNKQLARLNRGMSIESTKPNGSGIGTSSITQFAKDAKWHIKYSNNLQKGGRVTFSLETEAK